MLKIHINVDSELECYHRRQTKLQESNIFTGVCLLTGGGGGYAFHNAMGQANPYRQTPLLLSFFYFGEEGGGIY